MMRKLPIFITACWKCETFRRWPQVLPSGRRRCCSPVAVTTATISPCLTIEPEYASSPTFFATGSDSPGERGLIDAEIIAVDQFAVSRHDVAQVEADHVARHERLGVDLLPRVPSRSARALRASEFFSESERVGSCMFLPKAEQRR